MAEKFGARDVANVAATFGILEADAETRALYGTIGLWALKVKKAHDAGDEERLTALIEGDVDLKAEANEAMAEPGAAERAREIQNKVIGEALGGIFGGRF